VRGERRWASGWIGGAHGGSLSLLLLPDRAQPAPPVFAGLSIASPRTGILRWSCQTREAAPGAWPQRGGRAGARPQRRQREPALPAKPSLLHTRPAKADGHALPASSASAQHGTPLNWGVTMQLGRRAPHALTRPSSPFSHPPAARRHRRGPRPGRPWTGRPPRARWRRRSPPVPCRPWPA